MKLFSRHLLVVAAAMMLSGHNAVAQTTFCNPLNLDYRFNTDTGGYREAADPVVILFEGDYYIFASKSGGYWWSSDFVDWHFVTPNSTLDIEKYAPAVWQIGEWMYYTSSESGAIYRSNNPKSGRWYKVCDNPHAWNDPWVFVDDDGRVYAYWGSGESGGISCCELAPDNNFAPISEDVVCINTNTAENGYEVGGDNNESGEPWTEGAAMFKYNGKYYLTYATPGTQLRSYCDGYYIGDSPTGPFTLGANSPLTFKSRGYVTGVGHGGLFTDKAGRIWTIDCVCIANKAWFERRLAVMPVGVDGDGLLHTYTTMGDYPMSVPGTADGDASAMLKGWNLLSYGKRVKISSLYDSHFGNYVTDENVKTYWSAKNGDAGQYLQVDLSGECTVNAVQVNFYESETTYNGGRTEQMSTKFLMESSLDGSTWTTIADSSQATTDRTHHYIELPSAVKARYIRVTNKGDIPGGGYFAVSDLRVFGNANGTPPSTVSAVTVGRSQSDRRCAELSWSPSDGADGYIVRFGISPDKLWNHYMVWGDTSLTIRSLVTTNSYYYRVDAINGSGITEGIVYDDNGSDPW